MDLILDSTVCLFHLYKCLETICILLCLDGVEGNRQWLSLMELEEDGLPFRINR